MLPYAGEVSSNPRPHQKTMLLDLSRLVGPFSLLRQASNKDAPSGAFFMAATPSPFHSTAGDAVSSIDAPPRRPKRLACLDGALLSWEERLAT